MMGGEVDLMERWLVILVGILGGVAVGVQSPIAGAMGRRVGGVAASFIIHLSGAILSGVLLLARGGENVRDWNRLPWYMLGAGGFGLVLYLTINITLPRLGSTLMLVLIIIGQLLTGIVIDHFGLLGTVVRPVDAWRMVGAALVALGAYFISR